jgi:hypothetical protein
MLQNQSGNDFNIYFSSEAVEVYIFCQLLFGDVQQLFYSDLSSASSSAL